MSRKAYIIAAGCLIIGTFLGIFGSMAYWGKNTAQGLVLLKEMEIARYGELALAAYQNESPQIAIYALSQYLDLLSETEELAGDNAVFMTKRGINYDAMLVHARLSKVYSAAGQLDNSSRHIAEALVRASRDEKLASITNEAMLMDIVARYDNIETN